MSTTYGVIGVGSLAAAIVTGLCLEDAPRVVLSPRSAVTSADLAARLDTVSVAADNQAAVDAADVVLVCVLPQQAADVLTGLRFRPDQVVLSVMAGVALAEVERLVAPAARVARSIPMPSAAIRRGAIPVHPALPEAVEFWGLLGDVVATDDERSFEALIVPSTTVAAHFAHLAALASWVADQGVPEDQARRYVAALYAATAEQLTGAPDYDALAREVASPGGLNEQFARHVRDAGVPETVRSGLDAVFARLAQT